MKNYLLLLISLGIIACKETKTNYKKVKEYQDFVQALSMFDNGKDSAYFYFNKVTSKQIRGLDAAKAYCYMSMIQANKGDYYGSQESSINALKLLKEKNKTHWSSVGSCYNQLGLNSIVFKQYNLAIAYFNSALKFFNHRDEITMVLNNKALAYQKLKQYPEALKIYNHILAQKINRNEYARFLSNAARTQWLANSEYNAAAQMLKALNIRKAENNDWGLNASYSHLADYYTMSKPDSALFFAENMYEVAKKLKSADDQLEALDKLIKLSPAAATKKYFDIYQNLNDSLQTARNAAKNQFAVVRYESEKSKADNLILQKDNTEKRYQIIKREILLASGFLLFAAASVIAFLWYKKRHQKMELDKESAIQENKLKTSKKVHDVVANGLYRVMSEMENQPEIDRESIIDKIEILYEKSRDISYDKPELDEQPFQHKISEILTSFATPQTKVIIVGNTNTLWVKVPTNVLYELEQILQELMVNMKKHSGATTVVLKFDQEVNQVNIFYTDDGIGMPEEKIFNNGWKNTVSRIEGIGGKLTFETKLEKGLKVHISFPVS
ncbi:ATP-binding protein [Pedobacter agri]|uniref:tetratricopeptide repeat-containing sensor histidine kinase n=1 Tax=Pedobacter agri TaxID=454586 RepID=UPI00292F8EF2|nr:ATP-binding protein [Pedobacter agri]